MSSQTFHGNRTVYSEQSAVAALAKALGEIKHADGLTLDDMAAVLGKCPDQTAKYLAGEAKMDAVTFGRGKREWNGRFTGYFDRLCCDSRPGTASDREHESSVLKAALALSIALADDNQITAREVRANRQTIEAARDALDALLGKVKVAA
jgi:hypothetical protein